MDGRGPRGHPGSQLPHPFQGGSDLGANRTVARREGNAYRLYQDDRLPGFFYEEPLPPKGYTARFRPRGPGAPLREA